ncbi:MAG: hypothetical protein QM775_00600 [Pirellulales bacterium]
MTGKSQVDPLTLRNSLGDLTKRENRSLHQPFLWPYQMMYIAPQIHLQLGESGLPFFV